MLKSSAEPWGLENKSILFLGSTRAPAQVDFVSPVSLLVGNIYAWGTLLNCLLS